VEDGEVIPFTLAWFSNESSGSTSFSEMIVAPTLNFSNVTILDFGTGDSDGILDPGETVQLMVSLANAGNGTAHNVTGSLISDNPTYITISDAGADFPDISGGGSGASLEPHFTAAASSAIPDHTIVTFTLSVSADGYTVNMPFQIDVTSSTFAKRFSWNMDTDPGWTGESDWEWGVPQGIDGDPSSGYTGTHVYGYNLAGEYTDNMPATNLTTGSIDCSNLTGVEVRFMRLLGVESSNYDHATFKVSNNGTTWSTVWDHSGSTLTDTTWQSMTYDISSFADGQSTVYLRWVMGTTDGSVTYFGWNLDDVELWAESSGPTSPSPTRTPTWTPVPPTVTPTRTPTPTINTPTATYTPVLPTNTPIPTSTALPPTITPPPTQTSIPTSTAVPPTFTPEPTATSSPIPDKGMELVMEDTELNAGDELYLHMFLHNPDDVSYVADAYILLGIYGNYWCWPSWIDINSGIDLKTVTVQAASSYSEDILKFAWPANVSPMASLQFIGALFEPESWTMIGDIQIIPWGCQ
jgi:hypothetical protein